MPYFLKNLFLPITLMFVVTACITSRDNKELAYAHYKMGVTLMNQGHNEKALSELLLAKELNSSDEKIWNQLGLAYYFQNEYEHAIVSLKNAVSKNDNYSEAHNNLGRVYIDIKDFKSARKHLLTASSDLTYPHKDKVWFNIGLSYFEQGQYNNGQKYFLKSISANRKNCLAYNYYGRSLIEMEKFNKARKALDQAIFHCQTSGFDEPHYYSAIALFRSGYKSRALSRLQEGKKLYPKGPYQGKIVEMMKLMKITETK